MGTGPLFQVEGLTIAWAGCHPDNFATGRGGLSPEAIVNHIADGPGSAVLSWFAMGVQARREAQVRAGQTPNAGPSSAHFLVWKSGLVTQFVALADTAFATGVEDGGNPWVVQENPGASANALTVSIEHEGKPGELLTAAQFRSSVRLQAAIYRESLRAGGASNLAIDRNHITMHSDFSPVQRARCPGWGEPYHQTIIAAVAQEVAALDGGDVDQPPEAAEVVRLRAALRRTVDDLTAVEAFNVELAKSLDIAAKTARDIAVGARAGITRAVVELNR